jgi:hypothetical protein
MAPANTGAKKQKKKVSTSTNSGLDDFESSPLEIPLLHKEYG